jgi:hypothetical protein
LFCLGCRTRGFACGFLPRLVPLDQICNVFAERLRCLVLAVILAGRDLSDKEALARGAKRRPIPESWRHIGPRSSPFQMTGNHNAAHPVNAMLNYAYAVLESQIRIKAISEGYDPTLGIMHQGRDKSSKFVFDLMKPERPKIDRRILEFVKNSIFDPADFTIRSDGVCRLNPEMARSIVKDISATS